MPFNGSGNFGRLYNWVNDKNNGIKINASRMDGETDGIASGLSQCITKDGQTTVTANLPMAGFHHTGVGNATTRTDYLALGQFQDGSAIWGGTAGGTADVITLNLTPAVTALTNGMTIKFIASGANTTNVTLAVNGLTAKAVTKYGNTALVAADIASGMEVEVVYDGTQFQIQNPKTASIVGQNNAFTGTNSFAAATTFNAAVTMNGAVSITAVQTHTAKLNTAASATGAAGLNLAVGVAPTAPVDGDMWATTAALFARINGVSQQLAPTSSVPTVTSWVAYTPTFTGFGTASSVSFFSRRVGDTLEVRGLFAAGASTAVEARVTLGFNGTNGGVTSDSGKLGSGVNYAGTALLNVASPATVGVLIEPSVGYMTFGIQSATLAGLTKVTGSGFISGGQGIAFTASIPISGW